MTTYVLYGSGDHGTKEMREILDASGVDYEFRDIRSCANDRANLAMMLRKGIRTVPAMFDPKHRYMGDFDKTLLALNIDPAHIKMPAPTAA